MSSLNAISRVGAPPVSSSIGVAHHGGAQHFVERADVRQARGAVAGLEQHRLARRACRRASASAACALPHRARPCWSWLHRGSIAVGAQLLPFRSARPLDRLSWPLLCLFQPSMQPMPASGCAAMARSRRRRGRGDRPAGGNAAHHPERAAGRPASRLCRRVRARPAGAVRLRPSGALRGADVAGLARRLGSSRRRRATAALR